METAQRPWDEADGYVYEPRRLSPAIHVWSVSRVIQQQLVEEPLETGFLYYFFEGGSSE